ncbi:hypothetical protein V1477_001419 [Vespula maculifrons]|uniref:Uncharacterized protein n=1 Tax=Vespula maculifrons TaxID=7453 RepID=A0ABD2CZ13_VESMC
MKHTYIGTSCFSLHQTICPIWIRQISDRTYYENLLNFYTDFIMATRVFLSMSGLLGLLP